MLRNSIFPRSTTGIKALSVEDVTTTDLAVVDPDSGATILSSDQVSTIINNDVTINGGLNVIGSTINYNVDNVYVKDNLVKYAYRNTSSLIDVGWYFPYGASSLLGGMVYDHLDNYFKIFTGVSAADPTTTLSIPDNKLGLVKCAQLTANSYVNTNNLNVISGSAISLTGNSLTYVRSLTIDPTYMVSMATDYNQRFIDISGTRTISGAVTTGQWNLINCAVNQKFTGSVTSGANVSNLRFSPQAEIPAGSTLAYLTGLYISAPTKTNGTGTIMKSACAELYASTTAGTTNYALICGGYCELGQGSGNLSNVNLGLPGSSNIYNSTINAAINITTLHNPTLTGNTSIMGGISMTNNFQPVSDGSARTISKLAHINLNSGCTIGTNLTVNNYYHAYMDCGMTNNGTITNAYGLYVNTPSQGTNKYGVKIDGTGGLLFGTDANQTVLNNYETTTLSMSFSGAFSGSATVKFQKIGNNAFVTFPTIQNPAGSAANVVFSTQVPARFRPSNTTRFCAKGLDNGVNDNCIYEIDTSGNVRLGHGVDPANGFTVGASSSGPFQCSSNWLI